MNLILSPAERNAIHNKQFFITKASATKKIEHILALVRDGILEEIKAEKLKFPSGVDARNGKIFRGENYRGLPYLVLDFPKHFSKDSVMAFRTMFWWGNFYSMTMHLQGNALSSRRETLISNINKIRKPGLFVCTGDSPWQYHYGKDNYSPANSMKPAALRKLFREKEFVKLSRRFRLDDGIQLPVKAPKTFLELYRTAFELFRTG